MRTASLEQSARKLVNRVVARTDAGRNRAGNASRPDAGGSGGSGGVTSLDAATVAWMLPHLAQLVNDLHDQPIQQLEPVIRRMLMEQAFVDDNGDVVMSDADRNQIDRQVRWIIRILAHARRRSQGSGQWSCVPITPQMCG